MRGIEGDSEEFLQKETFLPLRSCIDLHSARFSSLGNKLSLNTKSSKSHTKHMLKIILLRVLNVIPRDYK